MKKTLASKKVTVTRQEANFDRACDEAYDRAVLVFGIDDCGHSAKVKGWDRSSCYVVVTFTSYCQTGGMGGDSYTYEFQAEARRG